MADLIFHFHHQPTLDGRLIDGLWFPLPRKFSNIPTFQWKLFPEENRLHHHQLALWLALSRYWNMVQSTLTYHPEDYEIVEKELNLLEVDDPRWTPCILDKWNRHGNNHWTYLPCSYPLTITELFVTVHLAPRPRFPWEEKTGVYRS